uniref:Uncharacterized protein n=1 Tax=Arundo donax TaxID=35708 RepID=A0A0A8Y0B4_ARUDO
MRSSNVFPFPLNIHFVGSNPASRARRSSLPLTRTAPHPSSRRSRSRGRLLLAFTAYPTTERSPWRASR